MSHACSIASLFLQHCFSNCSLFLQHRFTFFLQHCFSNCSLFCSIASHFLQHCFTNCSLFFTLTSHVYSFWGNRMALVYTTLASCIYAGNPAPAGRGIGKLAASLLVSTGAGAAPQYSELASAWPRALMKNILGSARRAASFLSGMPFCFLSSRPGGAFRKGVYPPHPASGDPTSRDGWKGTAGPFLKKRFKKREAP